MEVAKMFELQKIDINLEKARRRLAQIAEALGESDQVKSARAAASATEAELHRWHAAQKDAELMAQDLSEQIVVNENELMSGRVRVPKELESLQAKVDSLRRQLATVEESGVEALLQVEEVSQRLTTEQTTLSSLESAWKAGQTDLLQEEAKYKRIHAQLKQQRDLATRGMDQASLAQYDQLRARKAGIAIAPLQNSQCGVCHIQVPTGVVSAARSRHNEAVFCPSCGRILFVV
jgi:predicted  nucleic acid-binding Zn-ribbon protein